MRNFFRVLRYARPYRGYAVLNVVFNLASTVFHLASLLVFIPFLNLLFGQAPPPSARPAVDLSLEGLKRLPELFNWRMAAYIQEHGQMGGLVFICVVVALCFLLKNLFRYFALWAIGILRNRAVRDLRNEVYDKILDLPMRFHTGERKGHTIARITQDVQEVEFSIMNYIEMVFREPITIVLSLALMIGISWKLTLIALLLLPLSGLLIGRIGKSLRREGLRAQQKAADLLSTVEETLTGMRVVKAFNGEEQMRRRFRRENEMLNKLNVFTLRRRDMASPLSEFLGALVMVTLVYLGGSLVIGQDPSLSGGAFIGYIILFSQLLAPAKSFTTGYYWIRKGGASAERIFELLAVENSVKERPDARPIAAFTDRVVFEGVRFAYDERPVLRTVDLVL
ncbi:MAG TPA: ABC transporter transmembrane domain-containing protein, partial [Flavobacteriales bacterium]|nr:ABC transporter transmembrane domain-containing protein [Flavobacteriales bacterium]